MKTRILLIVMLGLMGLNGKGQTLNWEWAKGAYGSYYHGGSVEGYQIATDEFGHLYFMGEFSDSLVTFGTHTLINLFPSIGNPNIFLTKYDTLGNVIWAQSWGGYGNFPPCNVTIDGFGNIYLTGWLEGPTITFGSYTLNRVGTCDIYLVKINSLGSVIWAKSFGGSRVQTCNGIKTDALGNIFITGYFTSDTISFGQFNLYNPTLGSYNMFVGKLDSAGNVLWMKGTLGNGIIESYSLAIDASANIYVTGGFNDATISFDNYSLNNSGSYDMFLVKYDSSGHAIFARSAIGSDQDYGGCVIIDPFGNIYVSGGFKSGSITFGSHVLNNFNSGNFDGFFVKYDSFGNVIYAKSVNGTGDNTCGRLGSDSGGNLYITGTLHTAISLDTIVLTESTWDPVFIAKCDSSGNFLFAKSLASGGDDAFGMVVSNSGSVYVGGDYLYNPFVIGADTLVKIDAEDGFIAKLVYSLRNGIPEFPNQQNQLINLYPNPASTTITIRSQLRITNEELRITDVFGRIVFSQLLNQSTNTTIDISHLSQGIYFYEVAGQRGKIVKE